MKLGAPSSNQQHRDPFRLDGKRILITGGSSGIGRACAIEMSRRGAHLLLAARNVQLLQESISLLHGTGHAISPIDLTSDIDLAAWMRDQALQYGPFDALVHSAGITKTLPIRAVDMAHYRNMMAVNLDAAYFLSKGFRMKNVSTANASLVFMGSISGQIGQAGLSSYCATKGALVALAKSLAIEFAHENIRVNVIAPGMIETPLLEAERQNLPEGRLQELINQHPLGLGRVEDVAYAATYLCSDASRWITGTTLVVDGGCTCR
jgi:NAD(P)-dependent dehydrogenase (short-subunit alcohol dehydrogenase family)